MKKIIISALVFLVVEIRKNNLCIKNYEEKHVDLLLIREERKRLYVLAKDFNAFIYYQGKNVFVVIVYKILVGKKN